MANDIDVRKSGAIIPRALAVEVLSPSDTVFEVEEKTGQWLRSGCSIVWVVNPRQRSVTVHTADGGVRVLTDADTLEGRRPTSGIRPSDC